MIFLKVMSNHIFFFFLGTVQEKKELPSNIPGEAEDVVNQPGIVVKANETRLNVGVSNINQDVAQVMIVLVTSLTNLCLLLSNYC